MIENNEKIYFTNITLFTTALCNLNCGYCYICKDATGCLKQIDDDLAKDFENGSQIKQVYDVDPEADKHIKHITLWGGEPFLHIERFIDHFEEYVEVAKKGGDVAKVAREKLEESTGKKVVTSLNAKALLNKNKPP